MNSALKLVIFDWDGTLFDSVGQIVQSLQFAATQFQQPLSVEAAKNIIGLGLPEVAERLFPNVPQLHAKILQTYSAHYAAHSSTDAWFVGVTEMLHELGDLGVQLAVATGKTRLDLNRVLKQTHSHDVFVITRAASETRSKPDPLMLAQILAHTGVDATQAIMVGDSSYDLAMACNIGMPCIGVSYGVHDVATLAQYQPLAIAESVQQLHQLLRQYARSSVGV